MAIRMFVMLFLLCCMYSTTATAETQLKAVFIQDHDLWMVEGNIETKLTTGKFIASPKWSSDGRFIAYAASDRDDEQKLLYI